MTARKQVLRALRAGAATLLLTSCGGAPEAQRKTSDPDTVAVSPSESGGTCGRGVAGLESLQPADEAEVGEVGDFWGKVATVQYAEAATGSPVFLNLGSDYPDADLSVAAFTNAAPSVVQWIRETFAPGDIICVVGTVTEYAGSPQIIVDSLDDVEMINQGTEGIERDAAAAELTQNTRQLIRVCEATLSEVRSWSNPPTAEQLFYAVGDVVWPSDLNDVDTPRLRRVIDALDAYQRELETTAYLRGDPNLRPDALPALLAPLADQIRAVMAECGKLR